jgi:cbb3-type cytochrome oxidase subunit 1
MALWFVNNFVIVWLGLVAIATLLYFVPKMVEKPLFSRELAIFSFWTFLLFGTWGGFQYTSALPRWYSSLSGAVGVLLLIPIAALLYNLLQTRGGVRTNKTPLFGYFSSSCWLLALGALSGAAGGVGDGREWTIFTFFPAGVETLWLYGFVGLSFLGAVLYILSEFMGGVLPARVNLHYRLTQIGVVVVGVSFLFAGLWQGSQFQDPAVPQMTLILKRVFPIFAMSTLGLLMILSAQVLLLTSLAAACGRWCCANCCGTARGGRR